MRKHLKRLLVRLGYFTRPAFLIIGAQKGGTKSLRGYLITHPGVINTAEMSEIHFFDKARAYQRGLAHYHRYFPYPHQARGKLAFDNTPNYLAIAAAAGRIHAYDPALRLICILRDPVERAFSAWNMLHDKGRDDTAFAERAAADMRRLEAGEMDDDLAMSPVGHGLYHVHLTRYLALFPRSSLLVLESSALRANPNAELRKVTDFLSIADYRWDTAVERHIGSYQDALDPLTAARLAAFYRPHNERLYRLLDHDFGWTAS